MTNNLDNITRETLSGKPVCCSRSEFTQHLANLTIVFDFKLSSVLVDFVQCITEMWCRLCGYEMDEDLGCEFFEEKKCFHFSSFAFEFSIATFRFCFATFRI